jgi:hypothetical protein
VVHKGKDQSAGLELAESFILCSHQACKTANKSIAVFLHGNDWLKVATGSSQTRKSCRYVKTGIRHVCSANESLKTMKEKLSEVRRAIFMNRREIVRTRLEAIVRANIPYS